MYILTNTATRMSLGHFWLLLFLVVLTAYFYIEQDVSQTPCSAPIPAIIKRVVKALGKAVLAVLPFMMAFAMLSG